MDQALSHSQLCFLVSLIALKKIVCRWCLYGMGQVHGRWHWEAAAELAPGNASKVAVEHADNQKNRVTCSG
jgi:hypothetical protein